MLKKLRLRFIIVSMSIVSLMLAAIFGTVYYLTEQNLEIQSLSMLRSVSTSIDMHAPRNEPEQRVNLPFFTVREENGQWIIDRNGYFDLSDEDDLENMISTAIASDKDTGVLKKYNMRYLKTDTPMGKTISFADTTSEQATLHQFTETCIIIGAISLAVFFLIILLLARWVVHPVDVAWKQQKQFVADASHELKTPLTVVQTSTDLLRQADSGDEQMRYLDNIQTMSSRMRNLVEELLILARSDNQQSSAVMEDVNFSRVVFDAILPFEPVFFESELTLSSRIDDGITVKGNSAALRQLIEILLDNSRKYSLPCGETSLTLQCVGKQSVLRVSNPSQPVDDAQCREVFKRFYRTDPSRTGGESFGLGLSIAESIVSQHRGKIRAEYESGIFSVIVKLPCSQ